MAGAGVPHQGDRGSKASQAFVPGMRLDRYELVCLLAEGGMGAVWLARYAGKFGLTRLVVVKVMLGEYARQENMRAMFIDEARIAASIDHPNVVSTLDVGEHDGLLFLVMNWVDGDSLSHLVKQIAQHGERLPYGITLKIAADICAGLHAAHELKDEHGELRGLVHRDVSPQNVLLATSGRAMLIDFGIAKASRRTAEETSIGRIKGKLSYMSPEQARTTAVDRRADVFAVGAVLYEVFSGVPPFERESDIQTLTRLTRGGPAAPLPRGTPPAVQSVVMRALALDPAQRFQTADEMGHELIVAMREIGEPTTDQEIAHYAAAHLAERRQDRSRAVRDALLAAEDTMMATRDASLRDSHAPAAGRGEMKATLEFDASPFASALGIQLAIPRRSAPPRRMPSSPDLGQARISAYPHPPRESAPPPAYLSDGSGALPAQPGYLVDASAAIPAQPARITSPPGNQDALVDLYHRVLRSPEYASARQQAIRLWNNPAALTMIGVSVLAALVAVVAIAKAGSDRSTRVAEPLPTMPIPTVVAPQQPLVQQGLVTPLPTWQPPSTTTALPAQTAAPATASSPVPPVPPTQAPMQPPYVAPGTRPRRVR